MKTKILPVVLSEDLSQYNLELLRNEGRLLSRSHALPRTLPEWEARRAEIKAAVWRLAGVSHDPSVPLDPVFTNEIKCDGYTIRAVHYQTRPGIRATASLYVPDGQGPFPGVLNVHGHSYQGRRLAYIQARAHMLAKSGYVCLSVDTWGMGERSTEHGVFEYHGSTLGAGLYLLGESLLGGLLVDNMRSVDFLASLPFVDAGRLGVMGESGGGNQTMWVGAMDDRLKAVVPVVSVGNFETYVCRSNCYCELLPFGLAEFEEDAILALMAPRHVKMLNALQDSNPTFYVTEMMRTYRRAKEVFELYGAGQNISFEPFDAEHGFNPDMRAAALGFMDACLKGDGNGLSRPEPPYGTVLFRTPELAVFEEGKRPAPFGTISEYCRSRFAALRAREVKPLAEPEAERASLRGVLRVGEGDSALVGAACLGSAGTPGTKVLIRHRPPHEGGRYEFFECIGEIGKDGASFSRWLIRNARGSAIPCLVRDASAPDATTYVMASPLGKQALADSPRLAALLADPAARIVLVDLFATGENGVPELDPTLAGFHTVARGLMWLGRTLLGEWTTCYRTAAAFAREKFGSKRIVLFGTGEAGVAAMAAVVLEKGVAPGGIAFEGVDMPESFAWAEGEIKPARWRSLAECIPGFAVWGDVARIRASLAE